MDVPTSCTGQCAFAHRPPQSLQTLLESCGARITVRIMDPRYCTALYEVPWATDIFDMPTLEVSLCEGSPPAAMALLLKLVLHHVSGCLRQVRLMWNTNSLPESPVLCQLLLALLQSPGRVLHGLYIDLGPDARGISSLLASWDKQALPRVERGLWIFQQGGYNPRDGDIMYALAVRAMYRFELCFDERVLVGIADPRWPTPEHGESLVRTCTKIAVTEARGLWLLQRPREPQWPALHTLDLAHGAPVSVSEALALPEKLIAGPAPAIKSLTIKVTATVDGDGGDLEKWLYSTTLWLRNCSGSQEMPTPPENVRCVYKLYVSKCDSSWWTVVSSSRVEIRMHNKIHYDRPSALLLRRALELIQMERPGAPNRDHEMHVSTGTQDRELWPVFAECAAKVSGFSLGTDDFDADWSEWRGTDVLEAADRNPRLCYLSVMYPVDLPSDPAAPACKALVRLARRLHTLLVEVKDCKRAYSTDWVNAALRNPKTITSMVTDHCGHCNSSGREPQQHAVRVLKSLNVAARSVAEGKVTTKTLALIEAFCDCPVFVGMVSFYMRHYPRNATKNVLRTLVRNERKRLALVGMALFRSALDVYSYTYLTSFLSVRDLDAVARAAATNKGF